MTALAPAQAVTLRRLAEIWEGRRFILVGATAVGCWMDMRWRATADVDVSVACDFDEFPFGLAGLPGWSQGRLEHRWHSPDGVSVDVLPAGDSLLDAGSVRWTNGAVMQLTGFRLAFEHAVAREDIAPGIVLHVPPLHVLVLLKMASYLDRPLQREHDLDDLVHMLRAGIAAGERVTEATIAAQVEFDFAGAFLLGRNLHGIVGAVDRQVVDGFLRTLLAAEGSNTVRDRMLAMLRRRHAEADDDDVEGDLRRLWVAFGQGFSRTT